MPEANNSPAGPESGELTLPSDPGATFETRTNRTPQHDSFSSPTLASPAGDAGAALPATPSGERFILHQVIGRGGRGEVWEATQPSLQRTIAVKRVRPGVGETRLEVEHEFTMEALTTARLDHPNIVPIYDFGETGDGSPAIAMKLVRGRPWSHALREDFDALSPQDYLARHLPVLVDMAQAVAFAHSRGIIHRDLKPSQVMTGEFGEVLLMDWGLAMLAGEHQHTDPPGASLSLPTPTSATSPSGTPAYMAPEQTSRTAEGIGTWTDVYLLGGVLYQLLTGTPPHHAETATEAFNKARQGVIDPPEHRAPGREVPHELRRLAMLALSAVPADRPPSALAFLDGVRAYLAGTQRRRESAELTARARDIRAAAAGEYARLNEALTLLARARSLWPGNPEIQPTEESCLSAYAEAAIASGDLRLARIQADRLSSTTDAGSLLQRIAVAERRQAARDRQRRFAIAASFFLLLVVLVVSVSFSLNLSEANRRIEAERAFAIEARAAAEVGRHQALTARQDAENLVDFMLSDLRDRLAPNDPKLTALDEVVRRVVAYYDVDATSSLGLDDRKRIARGLDNLAQVQERQGRLRDANESFTRAIALLDSIGATSDPEAHKWRRASAVTRQSSARVLLDMGRPEAAVGVTSESLRILARELESTPDDANLILDLASSYSWAAKIAEVQGDLGGAVALWRGLVETADLPVAMAHDSTDSLRLKGIARSNIGRILSRDGFRDQGVVEIRAGIELLESIATHRFPNQRISSDIAAAYLSLGNAMRDEGDTTATREAYDEAVRVLRLASAAEPANLALRRDLTVALGSAAATAFASGDTTIGLDMMRDRVSRLQSLVARDSDNQDWLRELSQSHQALGDALRVTGDERGALTEFEEAARRLATVAASNPTDVRIQRHLVSVRNSVATTHYLAGRYREALDNYRDMALALERLRAISPALNRIAEDLAAVYGNSAAAAGFLGDREAAYDAASRELELRIMLLERNPSNNGWQRALTGSAHMTANAALRAGRIPEARAASDRAIALMRSQQNLDPRDLEFERRMGQQLLLRARIELAANPPAAPELLTEATSLLKTAHERSPRDKRIALSYAHALLLGERDDEARPLFRLLTPDQFTGDPEFTALARQRRMPVPAAP